MDFSSLVCRRNKCWKKEHNHICLLNTILLNLKAVILLILTCLSWSNISFFYIIWRHIGQKKKMTEVGWKKNNLQEQWKVVLLFLLHGALSFQGICSVLGHFSYPESTRKMLKCKGYDLGTNKILSDICLIHRRFYMRCITGIDVGMANPCQLDSWLPEP